MLDTDSFRRGESKRPEILHMCFPFPCHVTPPASSGLRQQEGYPQMLLIGFESLEAGAKIVCGNALLTAENATQQIFFATQPSWVHCPGSVQKPCCGHWCPKTAPHGPTFNADPIQDPAQKTRLGSFCFWAFWKSQANSHTEKTTETMERPPVNCIPSCHQWSRGATQLSSVDTPAMSITEVTTQMFWVVCFIATNSPHIHSGQDCWSLGYNASSRIYNLTGSSHCGKACIS